MAFAGRTRAVLNALETMVAGLSGVQVVYKGVPESSTNQVFAYVLTRGQRPFHKTSGLHIARDMRFEVGFGYAVENAEATAEEQVADLVDRFLDQWYADKQAQSGVFAVADSASEFELDFARADVDEYARAAGQEFRLYPITVIVRQHTTY